MTHDPKKLAYWADHHHSWQRSGLSQRAYCQREGLSFSAFDHWRRPAREAATAAQAATPSPPLDGPLTFIPVKVNTTTDTRIQLCSPGGWSITLPTSLGIEDIVQLMLRLP